MRFIDRSGNNGTDDYHRAGVTHLYLKATEGTGYTDPTYRARRAQAARQRVAHVGAYHFAGSADPVAEARHFLSVIGKPGVGHLRPCLDLEGSESAAWGAAFASHVHKVLGYYPVLYGSTSFIAARRRESAVLRACPWWRAEYGPNDGRVHTLAGGAMGAVAHQYTDVATFTGISGYTDASVLLPGSEKLLVPGKWVTVSTGRGHHKRFTGKLFRTRACAHVLTLLREGRDDITVKAGKS